MDQIDERLADVRSRIEIAAKKSNRAPAEIALVAVTKKQAAEKVREAFAAGQMLFGESRVQEACAKISLLPSQIRWHFIGHLQANKIRHALPLFELIHSVDSFDLAQQLDRIAREDGFFPRALLQVNVAGEGSKFGFAPGALADTMEQLLSLDRLMLEGLMTIPPLGENAEVSRKYFATLRELRDELETRFGCQLPHLSMGMSGDFEVAIEEGATLVRIGSAIFGAR